jgi:hypothetical protein
MCIHSFLPETAQVVQQNQRFTGNRQMRPKATIIANNSCCAQPSEGNMAFMMNKVGSVFAGLVTVN